MDGWMHLRVGMSDCVCDLSHCCWAQQIIDGLPGCVQFVMLSGPQEREHVFQVLSARVRGEYAATW